MEEATLGIMDLTKDFMVSPIGESEPSFRKACFLKPIARSLNGAVSDVLSSSMAVPLPEVFEPKKWPLMIRFSWWRRRNQKWVEWVDSLQLRYESVWKKVGIFEAIMSTKCSTVKDQNLCLGVAEKWCPETNTFLFTWGEATITLEDVMVLGGYPVVGDPFFAPLQSQEMREVEKKLILARQEPWRRRKSKAFISAWMDLFINSGSEIEHEAFLVTWLSMVGFSPNGFVNKSVFPIVIHLAKGNPIALGPAVLANIYKDLSLLKKAIVGLSGEKLQFEETLHSPFYLVQVWVWERFKNLQPQPNMINHEEPMLFRWHKVKPLKIDNVRLALDSAMEHFRWRPYVQYAGKFKVFYPENETLVQLGTDLDEELVSFVTCLRVSVLVGIQSIVKQRYLPHRVARQFGMDQDVPDCVPRFINWTNAVAWENYCRPIAEKILWFPPRHFEGDVTTRYAKWWKQIVLSHQDFAKNMVQSGGSPKSPLAAPHVSIANTNENDADVPPGFPQKPVIIVHFGKSGENHSDARKGISVSGAPSGCHKSLKTVPCGDSSQDGLKANENIDTGVPTICKNLTNQSFSTSTADYENVERKSPMTKLVAKDTIEPLMRSLEEDFEDANGSKESRLSSERVSLSSTQCESYSFASGENVMDLEQRINRLEKVIKRLKTAKFGHC